MQWHSAYCVFRYARCNTLVSVSPDNRDAADVHVRHPAQVVREAKARVGQLPLVGSPQELQVHLIQHPQPGGADGMAEAFQPAVGLAGHLAVDGYRIRPARP